MYSQISILWYVMLIYTENVMRDKQGKFIELAESRVNRVIKDIRLIGNLSNRGSYSYTDEAVRKIFRALQKELDTTKARFNENGNTKEEGFRL